MQRNSTGSRHLVLRQALGLKKAGHPYRVSPLPEENARQCINPAAPMGFRDSLMRGAKEIPW